MPTPSEAVAAAPTLDALLSVLKAVRLPEDDQDASDGIDWTDLPTFGGEEPADTSRAPEGSGAIWSWDATRLLVGRAPGDLEIVPRR